MQVTLYSTRFCPYCLNAKALLNSKGIEFEDIPVDGRPELREEMARKSGRRTVPQIWIGDKHIGGCEELFSLERSSRLDTMLGNTKEEVTESNE
jgi:glutaredoxin 3